MEPTFYILSIIKNLTEEQCVNLALFLYPNLKWEYEYSNNKWEGHDIIVKDENSQPIHFLQFNYNYDLPAGEPRFVYYDKDLNPSPYGHICYIFAWLRKHVVYEQNERDFFNIIKENYAKMWGYTDWKDLQLRSNSNQIEEHLSNVGIEFAKEAFKAGKETNCYGEAYSSFGNWIKDLKNI